MSVQKIISGAQTGADIAGLRAAEALGLQTGGYVLPRCKTTKGDQPHLIERYGLTEMTKAKSYPERTQQNVVNSDATFRFAHDMMSPGSRCTFKHLCTYNKPYHDFWLRQEDGVWVVQRPDARYWAEIFLENYEVQTLNVAGNSDESIEQCVQEFLVGLLS